MADKKAEKKQTYIVNADGQTVTEYDDRGNVTFRKRYKRGDEVELTEGQAAGLLRFGGLLTTDNTEDLGTTPEPPVATEVTGGAGERHPDNPTGPRGAESYSDMEYADLRTLAKERTGDGSGNTEALVERLEAWDEDHAVVDEDNPDAHDSAEDLEKS